MAIATISRYAGGMKTEVGVSTVYYNEGIPAEMIIQKGRNLYGKSFITHGGSAGITLSYLPVTEKKE